jgi:hypothetical protein
MTRLAALLVALVLGVGATAVQARPLSERPPDASVVVDWNRLGHEIMLTESPLPVFKGLRALAMAHTAQHDALNAVHPLFEQFADRERARKAHPVAAAAQAAHDVLVAEYPGRTAEADALFAEHLSDVRDGRAKTAGIELGRRIAETVLASRRGDGYDFEGSYAFEDGPGDYRTTPLFEGFVLQPGFRFARPFVLPSPDAFRPRKPPRLKSREYATAFDEVKDTGRVDSTTRTTDQTGYAVWWMEFAESSVNRLARRLADPATTSAWQAARLFAQLNVALFDSYVAVWDSKFAHNHWRPYTAIREAATDGNPRTTPDPTWEPLRTTPPFPEYVSAHAAACGASFAVLGGALGERTRFTMETTTAPPGMPTRTFSSFRKAADECADSRVRLGWHFRYATDEGKSLGRRVAADVARRFERRWK